jgi:homoserine dehydrogenase
MRQINLALIGFGNVARDFAALLLEKKAAIAARYQVEFVCTTIATARHGIVNCLTGIDLAAALATVAAGQSLATMAQMVALPDTAAAIAASQAAVMIETTPLSLNNGEPTVSYISQALRQGCHVVTANKGPMAFQSRELRALAQARHCQFRYESAVMDGTPVFNLVEHTLPLATVKEIAGIVNSTTNFILTAMEQGQDYQAALAEAQRRGIAEADPSLDIDGWDAAVKLCVLANGLLDANLQPAMVSRQGIGELTPAMVMAARANQQKIRLIARLTNNQGQVTAQVRPEYIPADSIFYNIDAFSNLLLIETDLMGKLAIVEQDPALRQTAYGLFSDLLTIIAATKTN